jgi:hypothetical protein
VVRPPQKAQKKKNERMRFGLWGWPDHPLGPGGGFGHPLPAVGGGFGHLHALGGGPATPKGQNPFFPFFFFFLGLLGWPDHPQRPVWGGRSHPLAKNGVVQPPHFWEGGGSSHPDLPFFFSFFFFFFFFQKKKKPKMQNYAVLPKTASFWTSPKRRSFGVEGSLDNLPPKGS